MLHVNPGPLISAVKCFLLFTHWGSWRQVIGSEIQSGLKDLGPPRGRIPAPTTAACSRGPCLLVVGPQGGTCSSRTGSSPGRESQGWRQGSDLCYLEASSQGG